MLAREAGETLAEIEPWATVERRLLEAQRLFPRTETAVLIRGWIPASSVAAVKARLLERSGGRCVTETTNPEDESGERIPVLLSHSRLLRPFEMLVAAYGLPRYGELAPTPFVAVSYVLMFGMMFGDVGHGGLIALAGLIGLLAGSRTRWRDVGVLLLFNGLSSAVFGLIYGSIFGIPWLKEYALWHDPLEGDPMTLMVVAVGLGALLMSVGLVLNIVNHLQRGEWFEGVFDKFGVTGVVFYWGALLLLAKSTALQASGWFSWVAVFFLGVPLVCWTLKEPLARMARPEATCGGESGGAITAVVESIVGAFEAVLLYLSNTISFVRLAAYAMSHAALLMAAFVLAAEVERLAVCGAALSLVVIVLGNIIVLVLEGIVAAVQALRLEYYEFFGKFFSGDGQPFKPFLLATHGGWR
jgi:V/A-type H+-transporting ATPase subunit I